jgi:phospholipid/cholesterol/gamma-HCH transport system substrate-binding protein
MKGKFNKEIKIGILVIITIVFFIWGYNFLQGRRIFTPVNTYLVVYDRVGGLMESADVLLGGYKIGQVDNIRFVGFDEFAVRFSVTSRIDLPLGTVARMISSDILGTRAIELVPGTRPGSHSPGDTLTGEIEPDLIAEIGNFLVPLASRAQHMMESMDSVLVIFQNLLDPGFQARFAGTMDDVGVTAASLRRVMHSADTLLSHDDSRFNRILANLESVSSTLAAGNEDYMTIMENFASITDSLARSEFLSAINHLNEVLASTSEIMAIIGEGDGSLGRLISDEDLYNNLESAARNLDSLLVDLRERPGRYVRFSIFGGRRD